MIGEASLERQGQVHPPEALLLWPAKPLETHNRRCIAAVRQIVSRESLG
jgi:hypothetical protein